MRLPLVSLLSLTTLHATAFELPFQIPFFSKNTSQDESAEVYESSSTHRVAVIGAGAGGSSAAFWLGLAKLRHGLDVEIDVYDKLGYVGGRTYSIVFKASDTTLTCILRVYAGSTTVYPYGNKTLPPQELGASIFVSVNKNLWRATDEFNLTKIKFDDMPGGTTGVWDGERFVFVMHSGSFLSGWWETAKLFWRYGWTAPMRTQQM
jgi:prenylcysteine oxidase/farnesylcysteine lyase